MTRILGILNLTRDSFSDGGRYLEVDQAVAHAQRLVAAGADVVDLGAESTHPDSEDVPADEELARLRPVIARLRSLAVTLSVDTRKPAVMRGVLADGGVAYVNDVNGFRDPDAVAAVAGSDARLVVMHARSSDGRAERTADGTEASAPTDIVEHCLAWFERRVADLTAAGIERQRLILDPGMGFFLGPDAASSVRMLAGLRRLRDLGLPLLVSTSRKSFIGTLLGTAEHPRPVAERGAGTLATELWAALQGVDYIRTHDAGALRDGLRVLEAIAGVMNVE